MPLIILRTINSKKWNVFRRKASKKAFGGFQSATEFNSIERLNGQFALVLAEARGGGGTYY
jgi:hypothetical protein